MSSKTKTVLVFGTYDLLHPGHEFFLQQAAEQGGRLVVVIARDSNVERIKGQSPHQSEEVRLAAVDGLSYVAEARLGYEEWGRHLEVLVDVAPDVICLGYDQHAKLPDGSWEVVHISSHKPGKYKSSIIRRSTEEGLAKNEEA